MAVMVTGARAGRGGRRGTKRAAGGARTAGAAGCLVAATALLAAGCSSGASGPGGGGSGSGAPSTFAAALAATPGTSWNGAYFEFGDVGNVTKLNDASTGKSALQAYAQIGESPLLGAEPIDEDALGFDPQTVSAAVTTGNAPPHMVTVLYGTFDPTTIGKKLAALDFKQSGTADGGTLWALGGDHTGLSNPTQDPSLNDLDVSADRIVLGDSASDVKAIAASGTASLASTAKLAALASCLGSAQGGVIGSELPGDPSGSSAYVGIGLLAGASSGASEEVCVTASSSAQASSIEANWKQQIEHGKSQSSKPARPWSDLFTDPQATTVGSSPVVVRLTADPAAGSHVGTLLSAYESPYVDFSQLTDQSGS